MQTENDAHDAGFVDLDVHAASKNSTVTNKKNKGTKNRRHFGEIDPTQSRSSGDGDVGIFIIEPPCEPGWPGFPECMGSGGGGGGGGGSSLQLIWSTDVRIFSSTYAEVRSASEGNQPVDYMSNDQEVREGTGSLIGGASLDAYNETFIGIIGEYGKPPTYHTTLVGKGTHHFEDPKLENNEFTDEFEDTEYWH